MKEGGRGERKRTSLSVTRWLSSLSARSTFFTELLQLCCEVWNEILSASMMENTFCFVSSFFSFARSLNNLFLFNTFYNSPLQDFFCCCFFPSPQREYFLHYVAFDCFHLQCYNELTAFQCAQQWSSSGAHDNGKVFLFFTPRPLFSIHPSTRLRCFLKWNFISIPLFKRDTQSFQSLLKPFLEGAEEKKTSGRGEKCCWKFILSSGVLMTSFCVFTRTFFSHFT